MLNSLYLSLPLRLLQIPSAVVRYSSIKRISDNRLQINLTSARSIDDVYVQFKAMSKENPNIIQHSTIEIVQKESTEYFDKYSIIRLNISNGIDSHSQEIRLDSEVDSGHDYFRILEEENGKQVIKFDENKLKQEVLIVPIEPMLQFGATCKLVAMGQVDKFYKKDKSTPIYKNTKARYKDSDNIPFLPKSKLSIREIAKKNAGSLQGEILAYQNMVKILSHLGYNTQVSTPNTEDEYRQQIVSDIKQQKASIVFFSVSTRKRENGNVFTEENVDEMFEHVAMVTGYDQESDKVRLTHWGTHYWQPLEDVYKSSINLAPSRKQEYYKVNHKNPEDGAWKYKQLSEEEVAEIQGLSDEELQALGIRKTETPPSDSGFKGKILSVSPKKMSTTGMAWMYQSLKSNFLSMFA